MRIIDWGLIKYEEVLWKHDENFLRKQQQSLGESV